MSAAIPVKVKKSVVELAEKMVKLGVARSRSHAINLMKEKGIEKVSEEVIFWERAERRASELLERGFRISHGGLAELLREAREER